LREPPDKVGMADLMPDLSHLSAEERAIIEEVFQRQKQEEAHEKQIEQKADKELDDIEKQITDRKQTAAKLVGTQDDAICQICQVTKFADGIGHKCFFCQLRSCARCGGRSQSKGKTIWACSMCNKKQSILAKTGKWFKDDTKLSGSPMDGPTPSTSSTNLDGYGGPMDGMTPKGSMTTFGPGQQMMQPMQQQPLQQSSMQVNVIQQQQPGQMGLQQGPMSQQHQQQGMGPMQQQQQGVSPGPMNQAAMPGQMNQQPMNRHGSVSQPGPMNPIGPQGMQQPMQQMQQPQSMQQVQQQQQRPNGAPVGANQ
ncbi:hypothetical protein PFISCL1PPCAC_26151, partial [Pristionchus fissidentatus]